MSDSNLRSIVKTITWRITGSGATFTISYLIIGDFGVSGTIALIQLTSNTLLYYLHERLWDRISWQRLQ